MQIIECDFCSFAAIHSSHSFPSFEMWLTLLSFTKLFNKPFKNLLSDLFNNLRTTDAKFVLTLTTPPNDFGAFSKADFGPIPSSLIWRCRSRTNLASNHDHRQCVLSAPPPVSPPQISHHRLLFLYYSYSLAHSGPVSVRIFGKSTVSDILQ